MLEAWFVIEAYYRYGYIQCESKKIPPRDLTFFHFFSQMVENL